MDEDGQPMVFTHRHSNAIQKALAEAHLALTENKEMRADIKQLDKITNKLLGAVILASVVMPFLTALWMRKPT